MRQILLLLLLFSSLHSAISEFQSDDYQVLIGKNFDDEAFDVVEDHDYNISVIGYTQDFKTTSEVSKSFHNAFDYLKAVKSKNGEQLRLIKLNQEATIVNDINYKLTDFNRGTNVIKSVENGYLIGGYTHSGQMLLSSLDAQGNSYYLKQFGTANFDKLNALIKLRDASIVAIGTSMTSRNAKDNIFVQGLGSDDIYLAKFRSDGQLLWKKKYGTAEKDIGVGAVATDDGGFILLGISQKGKHAELMAAKINETGDTVWIKDFPKAGRNKAFKIITAPDGNHLISASHENKNGQNNIRLIKIDPAGELLWEKEFYKDANEQLHDIVFDLKGNIIGVGYSQTSSQSDMDALVRYYDKNANMIWERKFGKSRQDAFKSVTLLHDNSFAVAGFSNSFADKARQIWVLKVNDDGTLAKKQVQKYHNLYEALKEEFKTEPQVHVYKDLRVAHDGLVFKQGSSSLTAKHKSTLSAFMPRFINILSTYKSQIKNLQVNGFTSTEWNAPQSEAYLKNTHLSNDRAMHVLDYSYTLNNMTKHHKWLNQVLSTDGHSYSNLIYANNNENRIRSRRVEFEIRLR